MKYYVRSFSIGLFVASSLIFTLFLSYGGTTNSNKALSDEEMLAQLKDSGHRVVTESEYISLSVQDEQVKQQELDKKKKTSKENKENKKNSYTIHIKSGMQPSKVSDLLKENGLIKDARNYDQYLNKHNYENYIQLGKHKLNSDMNDHDIAEALTK